MFIRNMFSLSSLDATHAMQGDEDLVRDNSLLVAEFRRYGAMSWI